MTVSSDAGDPGPGTHRSPLVTRRFPDGVDDRPIGWWGTLLVAAVLATTYAALYFTYVYVRIASEAWPPEGIDPPPLGRAGLAAAALLLSAAAVRWVRGKEAARALGGYRLGMGAVAGLATVHVWLLVSDWAAAPFSVDTHAYGSLYVILPGLHAVLIGIGVLMALVLVLQSVDDDAAPQMRVGTRSLATYWYTVVGGGLLLLAVVYLVPHVWQSP